MSDNGLPSATHFHRAPIRLLNGVLRALNTMGIARVKLDEASLLAKAKKLADLDDFDDFGDAEFMAPMRVLLKSPEGEVELNPTGRFLNRFNILRLLKHDCT